MTMHLKTVFSVFLVLSWLLPRIASSTSRVMLRQKSARSSIVRNLAANAGECAKACLQDPLTCSLDCLCGNYYGGSRQRNLKKGQGYYFQCVRKCRCPTRGGQSNKTDGTGSSTCLDKCLLPYDLNDDGVENLEDLILIFRAIDDPLDEISPGDLSGDVNGDGVTDVNDAIAGIEYFINLLGAQELDPLTATFFDTDEQFEWAAPTRRRLLEESDEEKANTIELSPTFLAAMINRDLQAATCGLNESNGIAKGAGSNPTITWDTQNCLYDPNLKLSLREKAAAYANWVKYSAYSTAAYAAGQTDAAKAYWHYRDNTGTDWPVDYEKGIQEDSTIANKVQQEIDRVKNAVKALFDGQEGSFQFHSTATTGVPNGVTDNWRRTLGGHQIWSAGTVTYDSSTCQLNIVFKILVEDYYNFNPGQSDVGSALPDDENCLFSILGWAKGFYTRGSIDRTAFVSLQCCKDEDCGDPTEFDCECALCVTQCPTQQTSGGQGFTSFSVDMKKTQGTITVYYEMYTVPDKLTLYYEGAIIYTTGGLVSGSKTTQVSYGSSISKSTFVTVEVDAPNSGTLWDVSVSCPP